MIETKEIEGERSALISSVFPILSVIEGSPRVVISEDSERVTELKEQLQQAFVCGKNSDRKELRFMNQAPDDITSFEMAVSNFIALELQAGKDTLAFKNETPEEIQVLSHDNIPLRVYHMGDVSNEPLLVVPPCGMPKELYINWLRKLSEHYFVVNWEARGLFVDPNKLEDVPFSLEDQTKDLFSVIDHWEFDSVHLLGLCGGVVVALNACQIAEERFASLSSWHGDLDFGPASEKTLHQKNTLSLMNMGAKSRSDAAMIHKQLMSKPSVLNALSEEIAHLVLYPYASPELFYNYSRLNGELMSIDATALAQGLQLPVLIVTSKEDNTAHPDGSNYLGKLLPHAIYIEEEQGPHIAVFTAPQKLVDHQLHFLGVQ
ncbi:alpha/beta hydrolase [Fluviicola sp.]|uniref:alpha/beta fold hydrolase n=1 Tax=Fluviicola sp. TaxID=1917219 RepID=UPI0026095156|nr:alpha/beta hydrolase [Fluviicola sp.]